MSDKKTIHKNSLSNLVSAWDSDSAREAQKKGAEARKANKIARENLKLNMDQWKQYKTEVIDQVNLSAIDTLKILMMKALDNDDFDTAADLAKSLAEFEQPKLARVEQTVEDVGANELSDEELNAKLKRFLNENPKDQ